MNTLGLLFATSDLRGLRKRSRSERGLQAEAKLALTVLNYKYKPDQARLGSQQILHGKIRPAESASLPNTSRPFSQHFGQTAFIESQHLLVKTDNLPKREAPHRLIFITKRVHLKDYGKLCIFMCLLYTMMSRYIFVGGC